MAPGNSFLPTVILLAILFCARISFSEIIPHHGNQVDADGTVSHCLSCHDGIMAKNVSVCMHNCRPAQSHPVLKPYPPPGKDREYAPIGAVRLRGIKFEGNLLACISCHDISGNRKFLLVMENTGSRLCTTCHIIK